MMQTLKCVIIAYLRKQFKFNHKLAIALLLKSRRWEIRGAEVGIIVALFDNFIQNFD